MKVLTLDEYRLLELHQYQLERYVEVYQSHAGQSRSINNVKELRHMIELGSESKKTHEKYLKLKTYLQQLSNYLHKQSELVFPLLSDKRGGIRE